MGYHNLLQFLIYLFIFIDYCQTNYLKIYQTDHRQIIRVYLYNCGYTDDQPEIIVFRSLKGSCHGKQFLLSYPDN